MIEQPLSKHYPFHIYMYFLFAAVQTQVEIYKKYSIGKKILG